MATMDADTSHVSLKGDGHPVIIFPGLAADGKSVAPLRRHCESLGYSALDWGRGYNVGPKGDIERFMRDLAVHTKELIDRHGGKSATLIGWSLGGLYAREIAKILKSRVRQVITIGTPFNAMADHTNVGWLWKILTGKEPMPDPVMIEKLRTPPPVPTLSIYSRNDGVVAWQTCTHDGTFDSTEDVEIDGSHMGMGWNPEVMHIVGERLAKMSDQSAARRGRRSKARMAG
jgi:pimeloyl-ACP methyl ester carboxylesterase